MTSVFIDGAAGTTGLEIRERLEGRADLQLIVLDEARRKDAGARREALNDADVAILCLPDDAAREAVALVRDGRTRLIDASTAHRVADGWAYGFPELTADNAAAIAQARFVANPGCYPTGFLALVRPLVAAGFIPADWPLTCQCRVRLFRRRQGADCGLRRRRAIRTLALPGLCAHALDAQACAGDAAPRRPRPTRRCLRPSVARAFRGMIVEVPLPLARATAAVRRVAAILVHALKAAYRRLRRSSRWHERRARRCCCMEEHAGAPHDRLEPATSSPTKRPRRRRGWSRRSTISARAQAGAAVQNLNLMAGLDPLAGLIL